MNIHIGNKIKDLRLKKGVTQEGLAEMLGVTSQAVSKWENDNTYPDILLLPKLAIYFGISIDELFALTDEAHMERIQNMIYDERMLSHDDFLYAEKFLKGKLDDKDRKGKCLTLLAELYNHRAKGYHELAGYYAKEALVIEPNKKDNHCALREAKNGAIADWNIDNHHELIEYYKDFTRKHPDYWNGYLWLIDNLLADGRLIEAKETVEIMNHIHPGYLNYQYNGKIAYLGGNIKEAKEIWNSMLELYPNEWLAWFSVGDNMARMCEYDKAIEYFYKAFELQEKPRFLDALESIYHVHEIKGDYNEAIKVINQIIVLLKEEWNITMGESIDFYEREIERLKRKSINYPNN